MNKAKKLVNKMAKKSAEKAANSACCFWAYQPKEPRQSRSCANSKSR